MSVDRILRLLSSAVVAGLVSVSLTNGTASAQMKTAEPPQGQKKAEPTITLSTKPTPATVGETTVTVTAKDAAGKPMTGAAVTVEFVMPPTGAMGEMKNTIALNAASDPKVAAEGTYVGKGQIMMAGKWSVTVNMKVGGKDVAQKTLTITAK